MPYLQLSDQATERVDLYYEDHGAGPPVVLVHGWPMGSMCWEKQVPALLKAGYRVVYYDRRGFGRSSQPAEGYDYDTLAADLDALVKRLDLHGVALIGFSMGTGECARYLRRYGSTRVCAVAFIASILPFLIKTADNPTGFEPMLLDDVTESIARDRYAFVSCFLRDYYNVARIGVDRVSNDVVVASGNAAARASATALEQCVRASMIDFRNDLVAIDVPALVLHGDDDWILPIVSTGLQLHRDLPGSRFVAIEGGAHGLLWTHHDEVNRELLAFLRSHMRNAVK